MSSVIRYILDMLPYMLAVIPIHVIMRIGIVRGKKLNLPREAALLVFVMFIFGLASQAVIPRFELSGGTLRIIKNGVHTTNLIPFKVFVDTYREVVGGHITPLLINFFGNVVMFMPIGFFTGLLWRFTAAKAVFIGFLSSMFIEVSQLALARSTDVDDLILNTAGAALGLVIYKIIEKSAPGFTGKFKI